MRIDRMRRVAAAGVVAAGLAGMGLSAGPAEAKPARCYATDDGYFPCEFRTTDQQGSFEIEGPAATYIVNIDTPGFAYAFVNLGNRNISLPGMFVRQRDDPACWANPETNTKICAW
ncbi:hypothetical protein ATO4_05704 [Aurantimonas sp. 22II-16-19i]|nr:hypothetical protein ATO4_05704 [Aurantimonas sp. 22II-16-19i]